VSDDELVVLAEGTKGATGATATRWVQAACELAREAARKVRIEDLLQVMLPRDDRAEADIELAAVHEAGHAVVYRALGWRVRRVSIVAGVGNGGYAEVVNDLGTAPDRAALERLVIGALAGRAAEEVVLGCVSSGSIGDLQEATRIVASLHASFGLGETLVSAIEPDQATTSLRLDPALRQKVDQDLWRLYKKAIALVETKMAMVRNLAAVLKSERWLTQARIDALTDADICGDAVVGGEDPCASRGGS
jgi:ATP-dependent Zn protease